MIYKYNHLTVTLLLLLVQICILQAFQNPSSSIIHSTHHHRQSNTRAQSASTSFLQSGSGSDTAAAASWQDSIGTSALRNVESLAQSVTRANEKRETRRRIGGGIGGIYSNDPSINTNTRTNTNNGSRQTGNTASVFNSNTNNGNNMNQDLDVKGKNRQVVLSALESLERDMQLLDNITAEKPQLSRLEISILSLCIGAASTGPLFTDGVKVAEVLAPAAAALSAAIGIGAEYTGKVAVADGKEVAAATLQCSAEAEGLLAKAERVKAVSPLCVGISATAATSSLLAPVLVESFHLATGSTMIAEIYLLSPLVAVLSAAVASLSLQETQTFTSRAISVGNRRFAKSGLVGRTWLSASERIEQSSARTTDRWKAFSVSVLPAPIIGSILPGMLSTKAVIVSALAACQCAYFLAAAENALARGTDAVALKSRSAAVCDTYANQGARSAAILPFTSALSSLCAAATAAVVELPFLESFMGLNSARGLISSVALVAFFPTVGSLFAAAASVSKARCEVDAEAAIQAASTLALEYDEDDDPVLRPFRGVLDLIRLTLSTTWKSMKMTRLSTSVVQPLWNRLQGLFKDGKR
mmetsp:Transcript_11107/g.16836  ORF Transcript_11107/g.16836 Transcript_11107/m.16836 type:complete len:585 (+) Transcript_11107:153-1907(+)